MSNRREYSELHYDNLYLKQQIRTLEDQINKMELELQVLKLTLIIKEGTYKEGD